MKEVVEAFESVFKESETPKKLQTDAGKEFFNKIFKALLENHRIVHFAMPSEVKASVIEKFNRT